MFATFLEISWPTVRQVEHLIVLRPLYLIRGITFIRILNEVAILICGVNPIQLSNNSLDDNEAHVSIQSTMP